MVQRFKRKDYEDRQASRISPDESELDKALYSITELMEDAEQQYDKDIYEKQQKIDNDQKQAEVLVKAMETFGESRKRSEGSEPKSRNKRATGGETFQYLQKLSEQEYELRKAELKIKEKRNGRQKRGGHVFAQIASTAVYGLSEEYYGVLSQKQVKQQALHHQQMMTSQAQQQQEQQQPTVISSSRKAYKKLKVS